ncbi:MAG: hypothetical protein O3A46_02445 [Candidatus Poribacteria bacterium]|nr:hypothetical protein [Candidatus Poribacteria bacterium]
MRRILITLSMILSFVVICYGDTTAITQDGQKVTLRDDGTWAYIPDSDDIEVTGFRDVKWGSSIAQVMDAETGLTKTESDTSIVLWKNDTLLEAQFRTQFECVDGKLVEGQYILNDRNVNVTRYVHLFAELEQALNGRYGEGTRSVNWIREPEKFKTVYDALSGEYIRVDKDNVDTWHIGLRGLNGLLEIESSWETDTTLVLVRVFRNQPAVGSDKVELVIRYVSKDLEEFAKRVRTESKANKL